MEHMERAGLIDRMPDGEGARVSLTAKGKRYLVEFKRLEEFSRTFGVEI
jgi:predicted transcriptional regulator